MQRSVELIQELIDRNVPYEGSGMGVKEQIAALVHEYEAIDDEDGMDIDYSINGPPAAM